MPACLREELGELARATTGPVLPWVATDDFNSAVEHATLAWAVISAEWFLGQALDGDPPLSDPG